MIFLGSKKGFTLIELLVVISIIGLLSSVVLVSLNTARAKARDSQRIQNLKQLQLALELYKSNNNGKYPIVTGQSGNWVGNSADCSWTGTYSWYTNTADWIPGLSPTYIAKLPIDPKHNGCFMYLYKSNEVDYKILAHGTVEGGILTPGSSPFARTFTTDTTNPGINTCPTQYPQATYAVYSVSLSSYSAGQHPGCW